jgi:DivIVA domain-containing protein
MTTDQNAAPPADRGLTPADLQSVRFTRASMMRPGYVESEVDRVLARVAEELGRLYAEKAALRDQVRSLQAQVEGIVIPEAPSDQAVRILSSAQQTADNYVAEAEEFSRQVTHDARVEYEEMTREARETAGAILQAAQEAAAKISASAGTGNGSADDGGRTVEELQEQIAYLRTFGQSVRVQLRSYLEALIGDVEAEWGRADPGGLPLDAVRPPEPRSGRGAGRGATTFAANTVAENAPDDADSDGAVPAGSGSQRGG